MTRVAEIALYIIAYIVLVLLIVTELPYFFIKTFCVVLLTAILGILLVCFVWNKVV